MFPPNDNLGNLLRDLGTPNVGHLFSATRPSARRANDAGLEDLLTTLLGGGQRNSGKPSQDPSKQEKSTGGDPLSNLIDGFANGFSSVFGDKAEGDATAADEGVREDRRAEPRRFMLPRNVSILPATEDNDGTVRIVAIVPGQHVGETLSLSYADGEILVWADITVAKRDRFVDGQFIEDTIALGVDPELVDADHITTTLKDGVLTIEVPLVSTKPARTQIKVNVL